MVHETITVTNPSGLHMRPAAELSKLASTLKSDITIISGSKRVNPKSVLLLISAGITCGTTIDVVCEGETEREDLRLLLDAIASGFGE
jgi:phosphocarrier protein HPr